MRQLMLAATLFGATMAVGAQAADKTLTPQQQRMATCNTQAKDQALKGDERKAYISDCLKKPAGKGVTPQQQKMRECNEQATQQSLKGDDRKKFMSACLKKRV